MNPTFEMAEDVRAFDAAVAAGEETFPHAVVMRLHAGAHPLRVFREHRGLTQAALAKAAGTDRQYLHQIEAGLCLGSAALLARLARALRIDLDALVPWAR